MIVVVDYGIGNSGSILNMLRRIGAPATLSGRPEDIERADSLILPGVGAFDTGMRNLAEAGLLEPLRVRVVDRGVPVLGICLGMQLMTRGSAEGQLPGLGWIAATTVKFSFRDGQPPLNIPHMGWNTVAPRRDGHLFKRSSADPRFYFVHSYHIVCDSPDIVVGDCHYGYTFAAAIEQGNVFGTQFHPEKSHTFGLALLRNFVSATAV